MRLLFDRGTVLVSDAPEGIDLADVPGLLWDPRVRAHRAPARRYLDVRENLARRGVSFWDGVPFSNPVSSPSALLKSPRACAAVALRHFQVAALCAWHLSGQRGLVFLSTRRLMTPVSQAPMS